MKDFSIPHPHKIFPGFSMHKLAKFFTFPNQNHLNNAILEPLQKPTALCVFCMETLADF